MAEILAASADWALVTRDDVFSGNHLLVNLATGDVREVPAEPAGHVGAEKKRGSGLWPPPI